MAGAGARRAGLGRRPLGHQPGRRRAAAAAAATPAAALGWVGRVGRGVVWDGCTEVPVPVVLVLGPTLHRPCLCARRGELRHYHHRHTAAPAQHCYPGHLATGRAGGLAAAAAFGAPSAARLPLRLGPCPAAAAGRGAAGAGSRGRWRWPGRGVARAAGAPLRWGQPRVASGCCTVHSALLLCLPGLDASQGAVGLSMAARARQPSACHAKLLPTACSPPCHPPSQQSTRTAR